ncbi:hypothetical protein CPB86DRAFT_49263 [Serendipita vermifera]|nr:hypothetical protein CPB86DRAFT_49263 [Serendipita vermifera]
MSLASLVEWRMRRVVCGALISIVESERSFEEGEATTKSCTSPKGTNCLFLVGPSVQYMSIHKGVRRRRIKGYSHSEYAGNIMVHIAIELH